MVDLLKWVLKVLVGLLTVVGQGIFDAIASPSESQSDGGWIGFGSGRTAMGTVEPISDDDGDRVGAYSGSRIVSDL